MPGAERRGHPVAVVRNMRLTVRRVIEALAPWPNRDNLCREHPELEPEDIRQTFAYAARPASSVRSTESIVRA